MAATKRKSKRTTPKDGKRSAGKSAAPLKLCGSVDQVLSARVQPDHGDPVREATLELAIKYLRRLTTLEILAITPVLVRHSGGDPEPRGSDSA